MEALSVVTEDAPKPVGPILRGVCDGLLAGLDPDVALRMATERVRLAEFTMFAAVIRLQRRSGGGVSTAFSNLSNTLEARAERLPVLLTLPMLLFVVPGTMALVAGPAFLTAIKALGSLGG